MLGRNTQILITKGGTITNLDDEFIHIQLCLCFGMTTKTMTEIQTTMFFYCRQQIRHDVRKARAHEEKARAHEETAREVNKIHFAPTVAARTNLNFTKRKHVKPKNEPNLILVMLHLLSQEQS